MPPTSLVALADLNSPLSAYEMDQLNRLNIPDQTAAIAARFGLAAGAAGRGGGPRGSQQPSRPSRPHKQLTGPSSSRAISRNHWQF
tara:strand:- start:446 stop:703 length:258 start_codon:yes stop_codon:yes gene_type:complete